VGGTQRLLGKGVLTQGLKSGRALEGGVGKGVPSQGRGCGNSTPEGESLESQHLGQNGCVRSPERRGQRIRDRRREAIPSSLVLRVERKEAISTSQRFWR
jgi:hypothetical protein